jgi:hypothetical protein
MKIIFIFFLNNFHKIYFKYPCQNNFVGLIMNFMSVHFMIINLLSNFIVIQLLNFHYNFLKKNCFETIL